MINSDSRSDRPSDSHIGQGEEIPFAPEEIKRLELRKWILEHAPKNATGAEIGVFRGHFSVVLCQTLKPRKLYLVDPWRKMGETFGWGNDSPYTGYGKLTTDYARRDTMSRVAKFTDIDIRMVEDFSDPFLSNLTEKLDWVYLDASHAYAATLGELKLIDTVLSPHGVILGDDWQPMRHHKDHGVYRAIHDFIRSYPYEILAAGPTGQWCLRRTPKHPLKIVKKAVPGVCHLALDAFGHPMDLGDTFNIGGVVVLEKITAKDHVLRVINSRDGQEAAPVTWGIRSDGMATKYSKAGNSQTARFSSQGLRIGAGETLDMYLEGKDGKRDLLWRFSLEQKG